MSHHLPALFVSIVWGSTFLVSRGILDSGLDPLVLMEFRFLVSWLLLMAIMPKGHCCPAWVWREELKYVALGLCGGSLYFLCEYQALLRTTSVNVGVITSAVPLATTLMLLVLRQTKVRGLFWVGTVVALAGVATLTVLPGVVKGNAAVHLGGDLFALADMLLWAGYAVILEQCGNRPASWVTMSMLGVALFTLSPFALPRCTPEQMHLLCSATVLWPALYLAIVASAACLYLWQWSTNRLGAVVTNNYLYLLTVVPVAAAALFRPEEVTTYSLVGAALTLMGIFLANRGTVPRTLDARAEQLRRRAVKWDFDALKGLFTQPIYRHHEIWEWEE